MERRLKFVSLGVNELLDVLRPTEPHYEKMFRIALPTLPDGYEVIDVRACGWTKTVDVLISHHSFPVVPDGETPPRLIGLDMERVLYARLEFEADVPVYREL